MRWPKKIPALFKNFYFLTGFMFFVWILFLDSNNLMARVGLTRKLNTLENEKEYYEEKILEVRADHEELFGNRDMLEKFAREKYLMKKETEDVFLIVEE